MIPVACVSSERVRAWLEGSDLATAYDHVVVFDEMFGEVIHTSDGEDDLLKIEDSYQITVIYDQTDAARAVRAARRGPRAWTFIEVVFTEDKNARSERVFPLPSEDDGPKPPSSDDT